jgi:hypothetical protein
VLGTSIEETLMMKSSLSAILAVLLLASAANAQSTTYGFDLRFAATDPNLVAFPVDDPTGLVIVDITPGYITFAMDFEPTGTTIHVVNRGDGTIPRTMGTVDPATGDFTSGALLSGDFVTAQTETGLSFDPTDGTAYLTGTDGTATSLYTVNPATGVTDLVASITRADLTPVTLVIDISINSSGEMYAHDIATDSLYAVDKTTGLATLVGPSGLAGNFAQGMDFDPATDILYAAIYTGGGTGSYGTWDTDTGVFTPILGLPMFPDPMFGNGYELEMTVQASGSKTTNTPPDDWDDFRGVHVSGDLDSLLDSDNVDLCFNPGITLFPSEAPVTLDFFGTLPSDSPSDLSVTIESSANTVGLGLTFRFWNFNTNAWETVGTAGQTNNVDTVRTFDGTPADHVDAGTAEVRTRYEVRKVGFVFLFPWTDCVDQVYWTSTN